MTNKTMAGKRSESRLAVNGDDEARAMEHLNAVGRLRAPSVRNFCNNVREIVLIASSSRGGSSVVAEILRRNYRLLHFPAEINPYLRLSGHAWPVSGSGSDRLEVEHLGDLQALEALLAADAGQPLEGDLDPADEEAFASSLYWRLSLQWPIDRFREDQVYDLMCETFRELRRNYGWKKKTFPDPSLFHALFLRRVRVFHPNVNPWYYDLPPHLLRRHCPNIPPSITAPSPVIVEEPPFVTIVPWRRATLSDLRRPLVIKTPSNVYRLPFLQALFPRAVFRIIHLTRNAAAAINGLYDGWRFRGFFAHRVPCRLSIKHYTDVFPGGCTSWWKFDLPPGWEAWVSRPLIQVCGYQWRSAHRAVQDFLTSSDVDSFRIRFEDTVGRRAKRMTVFKALADWLGIPLDSELLRLIENDLPPIMSTFRPRRQRWREKADLLEDELRATETLEMMERLGYELDPQSWL